jgi:hypothetical protein
MAQDGWAQYPSLRSGPRLRYATVSGMIRTVYDDYTVRRHIATHIGCPKTPRRATGRAGFADEVVLRLSKLKVSKRIAKQLLTHRGIYFDIHAGGYDWSRSLPEAAAECLPSPITGLFDPLTFTQALHQCRPKG